MSKVIEPRFGEVLPFIMDDSPKFGDTKISPALPLSVLRNITNYMGQIDKQIAIEFLEECGISSKKINRKKESSEMIYEVLKTLAVSSKPQDRKMLEETIKASIRPSLYQNENITVEKIIMKYNEILKEIELEVINFKGEIRLIDQYVIDTDWYESQKILEERFAESVKKDVLVLERIVEIKHAYKLLIKIVTALSQKETVKEEKDMNSIYTKLFNIIDEDITHVHSNITNVHPDWNHGGSRTTELEYNRYMTSRMTGNFFQPYIYRDWQQEDILYKPFLNLFSAQSEMKKSDENWESIKKHMQACYALIEDRFHRFGADKVTDYPYKEYLDKVEKELKIQNITPSNNTGNLTFHLKTGKIVFTAPSGNTYETRLRRDTNGYLLLQYLVTQYVENNKQSISYKVLAEHLNEKTAHSGNDDLRRVRDAIGSIRRALKLKDGDDLFVTNYGFGLNCSPQIQKD